MILTLDSVSSPSSMPPASSALPTCGGLSLIKALTSIFVLDSLMSLSAASQAVFSEVQEAAVLEPDAFEDAAVVVHDSTRISLGPRKWRLASAAAMLVAIIVVSIILLTVSSSFSSAESLPAQRDLPETLCCSLRSSKRSKLERQYESPTQRVRLTQVKTHRIAPLVLLAADECTLIDAVPLRVPLPVSFLAY